MGFITSANNIDFESNIQGPSTGYYDNNYTSKCTRISSLNQGTSAYHIENFQNSSNSTLVQNDDFKDAPGSFKKKASKKGKLRRHHFSIKRVFNSSKESKNRSSSEEIYPKISNTGTLQIGSDKTLTESSFINSVNDRKSSGVPDALLQVGDDEFESTTKIEPYLDESDGDSIDHAGTFKLSPKKSFRSSFGILKNFSLRSKKIMNQNDTFLMEYDEELKSFAPESPKKHSIRRFFKKFGHNKADNIHNVDHEGMSSKMEMEDDNFSMFTSDSIHGSTRSKKSVFKYIHKTKDSPILQNNELTLTEKYLGGNEESYKRLSADMKNIPFDLTIESPTKSVSKRISELFSTTISHSIVYDSDNECPESRSKSSRSFLKLFNSPKRKNTEEDFELWNPYEKAKRESMESFKSNSTQDTTEYSWKTKNFRCDNEETQDNEDAYSLNLKIDENDIREVLNELSEYTPTRSNTRGFRPNENIDSATYRPKTSSTTIRASSTYLDEKFKSLSRRASYSSVSQRARRSPFDTSDFQAKNPQASENDTSSLRGVYNFNDSLPRLSLNTSDYPQSQGFNPTTNDLDNEFDRSTLIMCQDSGKTITPENALAYNFFDDSSLIIKENQPSKQSENFNDADFDDPKVSQRFRDRLYSDVSSYNSSSNYRTTQGKTPSFSADLKHLKYDSIRPATSSNLTPLSNYRINNVDTSNSRTSTAKNDREDKMSGLFFSNPRLKQLHSKEFIESSRQLEMDILKLSSYNSDYPY